MKTHLSSSFFPAWSTMAYRLCQSVSFWHLHDTAVLDWNPLTPLFKNSIMGKQAEFTHLHLVDMQSNINLIRLKRSSQRSTVRNAF